MMRAYKETYLNDAADIFGSMMDYAVNDCGLDGDQYLHMFIVSGLAQRFERGVPKVVAGMSGVDLATKAISSITDKAPTTKPSQLNCRTPEYWGGWALAQYQWYSARSFATIQRFLPFSDIINMYPTLHEADITKFCSVADEIYSQKYPQTNLKRIREASRFSQARLSSEAKVSLRSIQMYEQRNKDVNKAQAITLVKIARALGCDVEDLLEIRNAPPGC